MKSSLSFILCSTFSLLLATATTAADAVPRVSLDLKQGPNNPRNSEGAFITLKDGRILFIYSHFNGKDDGGDHGDADLAARYSSDNGETWTTEDRIVVKNNAGMNVMSVSLLRLQNGRLAMFYAMKNSELDCRPVMRTSNDEGKTWSDATLCVTEPVGYYVLNNDRVIQLERGPHKGRLIVPLARHTLKSEPEKDFDWKAQVTCALSDDNGKTWRMSEALFKAYDANGKRVTAQEPGVVELTDERILLFVRSELGQYFCTSEDGGDTWTNLKLSPLRSPCSPASIKRLPSGQLLAVWNDYDALPASLRDGRRTPLSTAISNDNGKTWLNHKALEGNLASGFCYTAIHAVGDWSREEGTVLLAYFAYLASEGITTLRIVNVPASYIFEPGPKELLVMSKGYYDDLQPGPFTTLKTAIGTWTAAKGQGMVEATERGTGVRFVGGTYVTLVLMLPQPTRLADLPAIGMERYTGAEPYDVVVEAWVNGQWREVARHDNSRKVAINHLVTFTEPELVTNKLRFRGNTVKGALIFDGNKTLRPNSYFND